MKRLRVLILGGTGSIGPHFVRAAVERGHHVSVFNRGQKLIELPADVERLVGDRDGDLESLKNRDWDAVLDLATYGPVWVSTLGEALSGRVGHYTLVSTVSVYEFPGAADETSKTLEYRESFDPYSLSLTSPGKHYGSLKALCEQEAERQFPGRSLILRPDAIVGPSDSVGAFTYWAARMEQGGEILAAGDPLAPVQMIDVRDLAEWTLRMTERAETGVFNAVGPAMPMGWGEMLGALRGSFSVPMKLTWVPVPWLVEQKAAGGNLLFWPTQAGTPGLMRLNNDKARNVGLTFRPLAVTAADTLAWYKTQPPERQKELLLGFTTKDALGASMAREQELLAAWHERTQ